MNINEDIIIDILQHDKTTNIISNILNLNIIRNEYLSISYREYIIIHDTYGKAYLSTKESFINESIISLNDYKKINRVKNIKNVLNDVNEITFNDELYNKEQLSKLEYLRNKSKHVSRTHNYLLKKYNLKSKYDYYKGFKVGDNISLNGQSGKISYVHKKGNYEGIKFSINFYNGDKINYYNPFSFENKEGSLLKRKVVINDNNNTLNNLSNKSTKELLYLLKFNRNSNIIKLELNKRENIPTLYEMKKKSIIKKRHGVSKNKNK